MSLIAKAKYMAELRVEKGWNKSALAEAAGISHVTVVGAEQGRGVSPKSAKAMADALGVVVTDLFSVHMKTRGS